MNVSLHNELVQQGHNPHTCGCSKCSVWWSTRERSMRPRDPRRCRCDSCVRWDKLTDLLVQAKGEGGAYIGTREFVCQVREETGSKLVEEIRLPLEAHTETVGALSGPAKMIG
jgi:hypothetical protein